MIPGREGAPPAVRLACRTGVGAGPHEDQDTPESER